ncbi:T9SS type A sorting domain-containing protein [bacterium]|nr:T9SS type A sorting domain-containing protein [bacterium]
MLRLEAQQHFFPNNTLSSNTACGLPYNGTITLNPAGGTSPYMYSWSNGGIGSIQTGLAGGVYTVTVTDAASCTYPFSYTVIDQITLPTATSTPQDVDCNGNSTGAVTVGVMGGSGNYGFSWNTGATSQGLLMQPAGTYSCVITDLATQCTTTVSATLSEPPPIAITPVTTDVLCNGDNTGAINLSTMGGSGGFSYFWSNGSSMQNLSMLTSGFYSCTVTDINGCQDSVTVVVNEPAVILPSVTSTPDSSSNSNGSATVSVQGGTLPYQYSWNSTPAQNAATATGLATGTYIVTITDSNGCISMDTVTVDSWVSIDPKAGIISWEALPNPSSGMLYLKVHLLQPEPMALEIYDLKGKRIYHQQWETLQGLSEQLDLGSLSGGIYLLKLTTPRGQLTKKWIIEK